MFEVKNPTDTYTDIVICRRNVNCASLTVDEFITMVKADMAEAMKSFEKNAIPHMIAWRENRYAGFIKNESDKVIANETIYAERKWKTAKRRQYHYDTVLAKKLEDIKNRYKVTVNKFDYPGFFDFDGNCRTDNSINGACILDVDDILNGENVNYILTNCFNALKNTRYFNKANGWEFTYEGDVSWRSAFRPSIKLIFDKDTAENISNAQKALYNAITEFYKNTTYFGD